jgi:predicted transcriptional regulator
VRVAIAPGDRILVYETKPVGLVTGELEVTAVHHGRPEQVLKLERDLESRKGARAYIGTARVATAIAVRGARYAEPRTLADLGIARAPQSYLRLDT